MTLGKLIIAPFLLPKILPSARKAFPKLKLFLREGTTEALHAQLMAGDLDLILIALPYELRKVEIKRLFKDPFLLTCRQGTKLVDAKNYRFNRLNADSVLLLEDEHCLREHAIDACRLRNMETRQPLRRQQPAHPGGDGGRRSRRDFPAGYGRRIGDAEKHPGKNLSACRRQPPEDRTRLA